MAFLIDTHNHLGCDDFNSDRNQIIRNCLRLNVIRQIIISAFPQHWLKDIQLASEPPSLFVACGIHPLYIPATQTLINQSLNTLEQILTKNEIPHKFCAVGEIGLDYYTVDADRVLQQAVFKQQLSLASQFKKPVLLHIRKAHTDTIKQLKNCQFAHRGIVHAFSGSYEEAKEYIKLGFKIGLGGVGTYPNAHRMHRVLQQLPLESIVLETDAPDLPPVTQAGKRNSPEYLPEICQQLAKIKKIDENRLAEITTQNACELFNWNIEDIKKASIN